MGKQAMMTAQLNLVQVPVQVPVQVLAQVLVLVTWACPRLPLAGLRAVTTTMASMPR